MAIVSPSYGLTEVPSGLFLDSTNVAAFSVEEACGAWLTLLQVTRRCCALPLRGD